MLVSSLRRTQRDEQAVLMPIELLDRLRALTHNMGWLDEGGEEQAAFVAI